MNYLKNLKEQFTFDQLLLIFTCFSFTFPFYILGPILLIEFIYLLVSKKAIITLKQTPQIKFLYLFVLISLSISIIHKNILGALATLGIFIAIILMVYYRKHINQSTFEFIIDMLIVLSILWAIYGIYEQFQIYHRLGVDHFTFKVYARRENRLNSVFYNANYYAMMIEFIAVSLVYKFFTVKNDLKRSIFYVIVGFLNLFMLYMTGCRAGYVAIAGAICLFLIFNKNYKLCALIAFGCLGIVGFFVLNPSKFPRIEYLVSNLGVRAEIWNCAIQGIIASPFLGQGPFTYMMILNKYNGHLTQHAHSVYLDPLLSFGIIGLACLVPYVYDNCKRLYKVKEHYSYIALVMGFIGVLLIHGILDYTIFWIHTGLFFLFVLSSFEMFETNRN